MRHAARAGLLLGLYFVLKYFCLMYAFSMPGLILLYIVATLLVPVLAYRLTRQYRALIPAQYGFPMSLAWAHGVQLYAFASLVVLIPHYIFYTSILPDQLPAMEALLKDSMAQDPQMRALVEGMLQGQLPTDIIRSFLSETSTFAKLWNDLGNNLMAGCVLSLINALILRRPPLNA